MKFTKLNIVSVLATAAVLSFTSCSKDDGAIPKRVGIDDVPVISTNLESGAIAANISLADQANFQGKLKVTLYFDKATPPTKIDVVARKNRSTASVKVYKADVTSLPFAFTITAADLATLFGAPIANGDVYEFAPDIYVGATRYEMWPASGVAGNGSGPTGMSAIGFGPQVTFSVKP